jgi:hypothetical protein
LPFRYDDALVKSEGYQGILKGFNIPAWAKAADPHIILHQETLATAAAAQD